MKDTPSAVLEGMLEVQSAIGNQQERIFHAQKLMDPNGPDYKAAEAAHEHLEKAYMSLAQFG